MAPLSDRIPKGLLPLWGVPLIEHTLRRLAGWGVKEFLINLHHAPHQWVPYLQRAALRYPRISLSFEPTLLGTGGALKHAAWFIDEQPFWVVNSDIAAALRPAPLIKTFETHQPIAALWLTQAAGPRTVDMAHNRILSLRSRHPGAPDTYTFCGLQLVSPRLLDHLPDAGFATLVAGYEAAMLQGETVAGVTVADSYWADLGTPEDYLKAHADTLSAYRRKTAGGDLVQPRHVSRRSSLSRQGINSKGFVYLGKDVTIGKGACLHNVVILDRCRVAPRTHVENAIVGPDLHAAGIVKRLAVAARDTGRMDLEPVLHRLGWPQERTVIQPLTPRGSNRAFTRVSLGTRSVMVIHDSGERPENARYAGHARFLQSIGIRVPRVLAELPSRGLLVMQDLGDVSLSAFARQEAREKVRRVYGRIMPAIAHWHVEGTRQARSRRLTLEPAFDAALYRWEHALFKDACACHACGIADRQLEGAMRELERVAQRLSREPAVLLHRDLQSSNILLMGGRPVFIDFQGMRMGPAVYDLASLLADPYVAGPRSLSNELLDEYASAVGRDAAELRDVYRWGAVQRLVQALGAFGRLGRLPGLRHYRRYTPVALKRLAAILRSLDSLPNLSDLVVNLLTPNEREQP